jgi:hypothetical protein
MRSKAPIPRRAFRHPAAISSVSIGSSPLGRRSVSGERFLPPTVWDDKALRERQRKAAVEIAGKTALVTGANRGLGHAFAATLLQAGASKVYDDARDPSTVSDPRLVPVLLDVTSPADARDGGQGLWRHRYPYQQCRCDVRDVDAGSAP